MRACRARTERPRLKGAALAAEFCRVVNGRERQQVVVDHVNLAKTRQPRKLIPMTCPIELEHVFVPKRVRHAGGKGAPPIKRGVREVERLEHRRRTKDERHREHFSTPSAGQHQIRTPNFYE